MNVSLNDSPAISVCVLTWNQAGYIRQAVESVVSQAVDAKIEVLVGDDCSTDGTDDVVRAMELEFPGVVRLVRHVRQLGASSNYQKLLALARGQFIAHLDGDDYWLPGKLQKQIDFMRANPDCNAVYTNAHVVDTQGKCLGLFNDVSSRFFDLPSLLARGNFLSMSSMLFQASQKSLLLEISEAFIDYRAHLRFARSASLAVIAEPLVVYRVNTKTSMLVRESSAVRLMYWQAILDVPRHLISDHDFAQGLANFYCQVINSSIRTPSFAMAKEWWPKVRLASPYGVVRTIWLIAKEGVRIAFKKLLGVVNSGAGGPRPRVRYRR
ncbi:MAG: glycosyltransferase family 2 protein [Nitrospiraceae bacterium]